MAIKTLLKNTSHRPWELPNNRWKFYQEWNNAIFLHWAVDLKMLQKFVPKELEIDLIDGKAWVSLVAFTMEKIRPKNLPAFSPISNFHEINIRTYVKSRGKTGVYFLSIEGSKNISCKIAKGLSELPYRFSSIRRTQNTYESSNNTFNDILRINYRIGAEKSNKNEIDKWLTERYALFQDTAHSINEFEIHHLEWPLQELVIEKIDLNYPRFNTLLSTKPDITAYSTGVKVLAWGKNKSIFL